ncbi:serine/threonine protein kinase [Variovorax sp. PBL-E5]|uniref:serine/threonine protein kinase n=1 Tax=Variovorax sp. PBL-E5 TaxID=434014 RepID=UPI00131873C2|nr:serine/threonine-protein kinase [Variovorax sp. PBL-E5]VTU20399.1 Serine/threonine-protein kinase PknK [Variovorax sp. PBL-E5]
MNPAFALDIPTVPGPAAQVDDYLSLALDWADSVRDTAHTLPEGMRLLDYEIIGPVGEGGFGIVYLAWDHALQQHVAIKEYLPAVLASRASVSSAVVVKSQRHMDNFRIGLRSFVNEARILARFDHPSLVRVLHFWEGNGTAYMAMPYYEGPTLARALAELGRPPEEAELLEWLRPLLDALGAMHAQSCFHRDIAPDNILLTDHGPVLLDFGAARRVIDGLGNSPTVVFKPGFAPIEQYGEVASMTQGAWTDVYALAGVVYAAITGQPPTPSIERLMDDRLQPLSELARGRYSDHFLAAVDAALSLHPRNRPQSAAEFLARLSCAQRLEDLDLVRALRGLDAQERAAPPAATNSATIEAARPTETCEPELPQCQVEVADGPMPQTEPPAPRVEPWVFAAMTRRTVPRVARRRFGGPTKLAALAVAAVVLAGAFVVSHQRTGAPVLAAPAATSLASVPVPAAAVPVPEPTPQPVEAAPAPETARLEPTTPPVPERHEAPRSPIVEQPSLRFDTPDARPAAEPSPAQAAAPAAVEPLRKAMPRAPVGAARATRREVRAPASEAIAPPATVPAAVPDIAQARARCTEMLQRASLEALAPGEAAFLRKECE